NHKTVAQRYVEALYFLDRPLFSVIDTRDRRSQWLPKFLRSSDDDLDVSGAEAINNIKHQNREAKLKLTPDELKTMHKQHAAEFGDQPACLVTEATQQHLRPATEEKTQERAQAAVAFARDRLGERSAVFEHFEVIRDALWHVQGK